MSAETLRAHGGAAVAEHPGGQHQEADQAADEDDDLVADVRGRRLDAYTGEREGEGGDDRKRGALGEMRLRRDEGPAVPCGYFAH